jgi:hypothetical protein
MKKSSKQQWDARSKTDDGREKKQSKAIEKTERERERKKQGYNKREEEKLQDGTVGLARNGQNNKHINKRLQI